MDIEEGREERERERDISHPYSTLSVSIFCPWEKLSGPDEVCA